MPPPSVVRHNVSGVYLHELFLTISAVFGYSDELAESYLDDIGTLVELWTNQGYIEVYTDNADRQYGRAKDSNSTANSSPWYIGLFHARILPSGENDPLIVIVLEDVDEAGVATKVASLRFMLDHDDMFGELGRVKFDENVMRAIRKRVDSCIQQGNTD